MKFYFSGNYFDKLNLPIIYDAISRDSVFFVINACNNDAGDSLLREISGKIERIIIYNE